MLDVHAAFVHADVGDEVYANMPPGYEAADDITWSSLVEDAFAEPVVLVHGEGAEPLPVGGDGGAAQPDDGSDEDEDAEAYASGGSMDKASMEVKNDGNAFKTAYGLFKALSRGAHIVNDAGRGRREG